MGLLADGKKALQLGNEWWCGRMGNSATDLEEVSPKELGVQGWGIRHTEDLGAVGMWVKRKPAASLC